MIFFIVPTRPVIQLTDIHKIYRTGEVDVHAVRGVSLDILPGEFVAIMGSSGSGKSTLMNTIGCLDRPTSGSYLLDGIDVSTLDRDQRAEIRNDKLGFVFQGFNLLSRTTALENVEMPMLYNHRRIHAHEQRERARRALGLVGLAERADHKPNQLSGGQQQRVAVARALSGDPLILLADEPTGNLDSANGEAVMSLLRELHAAGSTICMVTHDPRYAEFADRTIRLFDGRIVEESVESARN